MRLTWCLPQSLTITDYKIIIDTGVRESIAVTGDLKIMKCVCSNIYVSSKVKITISTSSDCEWHIRPLSQLSHESIRDDMLSIIRFIRPHIRAEPDIRGKVEMII